MPNRARFASSVPLAAVISTLLLGSTAAAAGPYEPNDTLLTAAGPLLSGQTYFATIEEGAVESDRDYYYFYVTSPHGSAVALTVKNLSGGTPISDIDARIVDSSDSPVSASLSYLEDGESRTTTVTLKPQKYFVEVTSNEGTGDAYEIAPAGSDGAFGKYGAIAARCSAATSSVKALEAKLSRATIRLQRATNGVRRARYSGNAAQAAARDLYRKAKASFTAKKQARAGALESQKPWCLIPQ